MKAYLLFCAFCAFLRLFFFRGALFFLDRPTVRFKIAVS